MRSFAVSDGREMKALKIESVLSDALQIKNTKGFLILDIGSGSGHIASHFAEKNQVTAIDLENQLTVDSSKFHFEVLDTLDLPFENATFDIVILNQVLTYVPDQILQVKEISRVLKKSGICYISLPNKFFPIEPHSHIPFIHYLPQSIYENLIGLINGKHENVKILSYKEMLSLFEYGKFFVRDYTSEILNNPVRYNSGLKIKLPKWKWLARLSPTNIFILSKK
jgi:ubiquinone/menaquinone biosynthesis C-methylase UbiE